MILEDVMDELGDCLNKVSPLRVHPYEEKKVTPPAALISLPQAISFDQTYGRGQDKVTIEVTVLVSETGGARVTRSAIAPYADGSGTMSIKQAIEQHQYTSCDTVLVKSARFDVVTIAGVRYLAVIFSVEITGQGGST
jgi:hypothetical protein